MNGNKRELNIHGSSQHSVNIAGDHNVVNIHNGGMLDLPQKPSFLLQFKRLLNLTKFSGYLFSLSDDSSNLIHPTEIHSFIELNRRFFDVSESQDSEETALQSYVSSLLGQETGIDWNELLQSRIVVILGEPGSGKTWEIRHRARIIRTGNQFAFFINLEWLINSNFRDALSPKDKIVFLKWQQSRETAFFFLDSVDEAKIRSQKDFAKALDNFVGGIGLPNLSRIHVIISSRISEWRAYTDRDELIQRFGMEKDSSKPSDFRIVQMLPLSQSQVQKYADGIGLQNSDAFIETLDIHHAWQFAGRPIDVAALIAYWQNYGKLGNLTELIEFDIDKKLKESTERIQNDPLTSESALKGAECLGAAVTLCQCFNFIVPDNIPTITDKPAIDASDCLPSDWKPQCKKTLLDRAIFDVACYGRIRFHHRRISEYLTAQWFEERMRSGCLYPVLEEILFAHVEDQWIIRPNLRPVSAWLAIGNEIWNRRIREKILSCAPDLFLSQGDPESLAPDYKKALLEKLIEQYAGRKHVYLETDAESLARLSDPNLESFVCEKVHDQVTPEDIRILLLRMIRHGRLSGCLEILPDIVASPHESTDIKLYAVAAIRDIGNQESRQKLTDIALMFDTIDSRLCAYLCEALYPHVLDSIGLATLLNKVKYIPSSATDLPWFLKRHIETSELSVRQIYELLEVLINLAESSPHLKIGDREIPISNQFYWLGGIISVLLLRLLNNSVHNQEELDLASRILRFISIPRKYGMQSKMSILEKEIQKIESAIEMKSDVRHAYIRFKLQEWLQDKSEEKRPLFSLFILYSFVHFKVTDIEWLIDNFQKENSRLIKDLYLQLIIEIWHFSGRKSSIHTRIKQAVRNDCEFLVLFEQKADNSIYFRLRSIFYRFTNYEWKYKASDAKFKIHSLYKHLKDQLWLYRNLGKLRSGEAIPALGYLAREASEDQLHWSASSWQTLIPKRGYWVAKASGDGWKASWRKFTPLLPHEKSETNETDWRVIIGLSGINVELAEESLSFSTITADEAKNACRYAINELNGFAGWLPELAQYHPDPVKEIFTECVCGEWQIPDDKQHIRTVLGSLRYEKTGLAHLIKDVVLKSLEDSDPLHYDVLEAAIAVLLKEPEPPRSRLGNIAARRTPLQDIDNHSFMLWLGVWLQLDAEPALNFLQKTLLSSSEPDSLIVKLCSYLDQYPILIQNPDYLRPICLQDFIPLVFRHIRFEEDINRRGVYTPTQRDDAQRFRNRLLEHLAQCTESYTDKVLKEFVENPLFDLYRDWISHLIEKRTEMAAKLSPWKPSDILIFMQDYEINPRTDHDLFRIACNRLISIKDEVERGDISSRSDLYKGDDEAVLRSWLARQLRQRSKNRYTVPQEEEIDLKERPDLRIEAPGINPISIEIKWAEHWSIRELTEGLISQLVEQYLRSPNSNYGIYILGNKGKKGYWEQPDSGSRMSFDDVVQYFEKMAANLVRERNDINGLRVVGINFALP